MEQEGPTAPAHLEAARELVPEDAQLGLADIVGAVHLRVGGSDDRHEVGAVPRVHLHKRGRHGGKRSSLTNASSLSA